MSAAVLQGPLQARVEHIAKPEPPPEGVRIRLEGCGVCGSNLPSWEGRPWFKYPLPAGEPGHKGWGIIDAVGSAVTRFKGGERVAVISYRAFAEFDIAHEQSVVPLPEGLAGKPFPGEALGCAMNVFRRCEIKAGQTVAVVGVGFLGALLVRLSAEAGARVIAIGRRPFALEMAQGFGARHAIPMIDHWQIIEQVKKLTDGKGCDCVIEAVGSQWPLDLAAELTCERGRLVIAGYHQDGPRQVNMQMWNWRGLDVINAHERDPKIYVEGVRMAVEAIAAGRLDPSPLYTHTFRLDQLASALNCVKERPQNFMKALVLS